MPNSVGIDRVEDPKPIKSQPFSSDSSGCLRIWSEKHELPCISGFAIVLNEAL